MEVSKGWCTTPAVCNVCGKKYQLGFECDTIVVEGGESWKLPTDVVWEVWGSRDRDFPNFKKGKQ